MIDDKVARYYDWRMAAKVASLYNDGTDYCNFGYWTPETKTQGEASIELTKTLLDLIPDKTGTILDVACGLGATTRALLEYYPPANVTAINISEYQLNRAAENAPGCNFREMNATWLDFPDASFDNVLCVESAFHFNSREDFLREAARVLKPGGRLILTDIIFNRWAHRRAIPKENFVKDISAYKATLIEAGFAADSQIIDATAECWKPYAKYHKAWFANLRKSDMLPKSEASTTTRWMNRWRMGVGMTLKKYILVAAHKAG